MYSPTPSFRKALCFLPRLTCSLFFAGYLAEQGLSATDLKNSQSWPKYALPTLGFAAAFALFWKLTTYAKHYQDTLEASPPGNEAEDTASEVVFLNEDQSVGPVGGLRSRTKAGEELTFSEDLGLVASPLKKGRGRKKVDEEEKSAKGVRSLCSLTFDGFSLSCRRFLPSFSLLRWMPFPLVFIRKRYLWGRRCFVLQEKRANTFTILGGAFVASHLFCKANYVASLTSTLTSCAALRTGQLAFPG